MHLQRVVLKDQPQICSKRIHANMTQFSNLSQELLDAIVEFLTDDQSSLRNLNITSKVLNQITTARLYRSPKLKQHLLGKFACSLLDNSKLAQYVHALDLSEGHFPAWTDRDATSRQRFVDEFTLQLRRPMSFVPVTCTVLNDPESSASYHAFNTRFMEFVLLKLPNLDRLHLTLMHENGEASFSLAEFCDLHWRQNVFPPIRFLRLQHWDTEGGFNLAEALPLLYCLERLEILETWMCDGYVEDTDTRPGTLPSVHTLTMSEGTLDCAMFPRLMRLFPNLESYAYEPGISCENDDLISTRKIITELSHLKPLLKRLHIDQEELRHTVDWAFEEDDDDDLPMPSLKGFMKLEHLEIGFADLTGRDSESEDNSGDSSWIGLLPESLKSLSILDLYRNGKSLLENSIQELVNHRTALCPNLTTLTLPHDSAKLRAIFDGTGIELQYTER